MEGGSSAVPSRVLPGGGPGANPLALSPSDIPGVSSPTRGPTPSSLGSPHTSGLPPSSRRVTTQRLAKHSEARSRGAQEASFLPFPPAPRRRRARLHRRPRDNALLGFSSNVTRDVMRLRRRKRDGTKNQEGNETHAVPCFVPIRLAPPKAAKCCRTRSTPNPPTRFPVNQHAKLRINSNTRIIRRTATGGRREPCDPNVF